MYTGGMAVAFDVSMAMVNPTGDQRHFCGDDDKKHQDKTPAAAFFIR
jgi:hypothetical protein